MNGIGTPETDTFLLVLDESDFASVGALLGLRARPASASDTRLVESYLEGDLPFGNPKQSLLVTSLPNIRPQ
ncbi:MAG: hypothetical protein VCC00_06610 [Deltaproteobacteria bacterium]